MTTYVTVHRPARRRDEAGGQSQPAGFYHDMAGEVIGFAADTNDERVLVALEDGTLTTFAPSELRAGRVRCQVLSPTSTAFRQTYSIARM